MNNQTKSSSNLQHKRGFGQSARTLIFGDYINKKKTGEIPKTTNFEMYCKQLIETKNIETYCQQLIKNKK